MSHGRGGTYRSQVTVLLLSFSFAYAQQPTPKPAPPLHTGSVTGQVIYEDTRAPARFVEVRLVPRPPDSALVPGSAPVDSPPPESQPPQVSMAVGSTDIDGNFRIDDVPTGDYIAGALHIGYLTPGTDSEPTAPHETLQRLIAALPTVHVSENQVARINLSLQRGAVIAGRVTFADGTPAVGLKVLQGSSVSVRQINRALQAHDSPLRRVLLQFQNSLTPHTADIDDQGRYRIFGLAPGKYLISTTLASQLGPGTVLMTDGSQRREHQRPYPNMTTVFAPGVFRRADARVFELRGDDEITDADLRIDSSGLHTIRGRIVAGDDHHTPTAAMLTLYDQGNDDPRHLATSLEDGTFQIDYVPSGRYTLRINLATDEATPEAGGIPQVLRRYKMASFDVVIAEHDVVLGDLPLVVLKPGEKEDYSF